MTEVFSTTSNLRVEQTLVHLGRFLHFSQKVVGVTLIWPQCGFYFDHSVLCSENKAIMAKDGCSRLKSLCLRCRCLGGRDVSRPGFRDNQASKETCTNV